MSLLDDAIGNKFAQQREEFARAQANREFVARTLLDKVGDPGVTPAEQTHAYGEIARLVGGGKKSGKWADSDPLSLVIGHVFHQDHVGDSGNQPAGAQGAAQPPVQPPVTPQALGIPSAASEPSPSSVPQRVQESSVPVTDTSPPQGGAPMVRQRRVETADATSPNPSPSTVPQRPVGVDLRTDQAMRDRVANPLDYSVKRYEQDLIDPRAVDTNGRLASAGSGAAHPSFLKDEIATQAKAFASEGAFQDFARSITERADYPLMRDSGLFLPSTYDVEMAGHAPVGMREESFASAAADKIPGVRRSSRAYTAAMDSLRVQAWDTYAADLAKNPNVTEDTYKAVADLINVTTGRGTVPILDRSAIGRKIVAALNNPFWSPRAMAARFNQLSPYRLIENSINPATRPVALLQLRDSTPALATVGTTMALLSQVPGVEVGLNPFGKNWGKVSIGNTHYDLIDGVPATARYVAQMSRSFYEQAEGKKPHSGQDPTTLTKDFLRRRLSPSAQVVANAYTGQTVEGQPFTYSGAARDLAVPFVLDGMYQAWLDAGGSSVGDVIEGRPLRTAFKGSLKGLPSVVGIPASTYKSRVPQRFQTSVPQRVGSEIEP